MRLSTVSGTAFVDFSASNALTPYIGSQITITDSASHTLVGYIKAAGTGETYGSELLPNTAFTTTTSVGTGNATVASVTGGSPNANALQMTLTSTNGTALETYSAGNGVLMHYSGYFKKGTANAFQFEMTQNGGSFTQLAPPMNYVTPPSSFTQSSFYATTDNTGSFRFQVDATNTSGETLLIDAPSVKQVLTPGTTGVTITSTAGGSTFNWASQASGFNPNDANGFTYSISSTPTNVWQSALTTQPNRVFFNGTSGTGETSLGAVAAADEWYWASNVLYVYSVGNPATTYTTPGVEASVVNSAINLAQQYLTINGLLAEMSNSTTSGGINIAASHITVQNSRAAWNFNTGMYISGSIGNILVSNNEVDHNGFGIGSFHQTTTAGNEIVVQQNYVHDNGSRGDGIISNGNYWIIQNNVVANNGASNGDCIGIHIYTDLGVTTYGNNNIIRNNTISGEVSENIDGSGIETDHSAGLAGTNLIYGNVVFGNQGPGIDINDSSANVYNNSFYGNSQNEALNQVNNTEINVVGSQVTGAVVNVKNNIAFATASTSLAVLVDAYSGTNSTVSVTNNQFYDTAQSNWYSHSGTAGNSLTTFNGFTGLSANLNADPLFNSVGTADFTLKSTSPARQVGTPISGLVFPYAAPDLGALPYYAKGANSLTF